MSHLKSLLRAREVRLTSDGEEIGCAGVKKGAVGVIEVVEAFAGRARVCFDGEPVMIPFAALQPVDRPTRGGRHLRAA